jgi:hypothetical protein
VEKARKLHGLPWREMAKRDLGGSSLHLAFSFERSPAANCGVLHLLLYRIIARWAQLQPIKPLGQPNNLVRMLNLS